MQVSKNSLEQILRITNLMTGAHFWGKNGPFSPNKDFFTFFFFWYLIIRPILQKILGAHFKIEACTAMDPNSDKKSPFSPKWEF